jgi:hypothetical protein
MSTPGKIFVFPSIRNGIQHDATMPMASNNFNNVKLP